MAVTVVTRWTTPNVEASTQVARQAKALWMKNGAADFRLSQIFTGASTGQWIVAVAFPDMATFGRVSAAVQASSDMQKIQADNAKIGAVLQEREILVGVDL
jgi:hypothetical protein